MSQKLNYCRECGRVLTDPESVAAGIGPECAEKAAVAYGMLTATVDAVATGTHDVALEEALRKFDDLGRILAAKLKKGYVAPKLQRDIVKSRDRVIRRARELGVFTEGGGYV